MSEDLNPPERIRGYLGRQVPQETHQERVQWLVAMHEAGVTRSDMARALGITRQAVHHLCAKHDIRRVAPLTADYRAQKLGAPFGSVRLALKRMEPRRAHYVTDVAADEGRAIADVLAEYAERYLILTT